MKRIGLILLIVLGVVVVMAILAMLLAPGYLKDYIEEHDQELVGREVFLDKISIGWFSGKMSVAGLEIRETDTSKVFLSVNEIAAVLSLTDLFGNHIFIESLTFDRLAVEVVQEGTVFNFDDLAESSPDTTTVEEPSEPWRFTMENFAIRRGALNYHSDIAPFIGLDSIKVDVPIMTDDMTGLTARIEMLFATGGQLKSLVDLNLSESTYALNLKADTIGLRLIEPYFTEVLTLEKVDGQFNADFNVFGSWEDTDVLSLSGTLGVVNFEMTDPRGDALAACKSLDVQIDTIRMKDAVYNIDHIKARGLYGVYEMYDDGDNFSNLMVGDTLATDSVATEDEIDYSNPFSVLAFYIQDIARSYQESTYRIKQIDIAESEFQFNDYTPHDPFRYKLTEMRVFADSLYSNREKFTIHMGAVLNGAGVFEGDFTSYTANLADMDINYTIRGTGLTPFAPYTSFYVAHPIEMGEMLYTCNTTIRNGIIDSKNFMEFDDFTFGDRTEARALYDLPVRLAVSLLKDLDGKITMDVPIEGDLKDPNYRLGKVIWNAVKNILLKAVTAPYRILARAFQVDEDNLKELRFGLLQRELSKAHEGQLDDLAKVLSTKPELNVEFKRVTDRYEEVEKYAIEQARLHYLFGENPPESLDKERQKQLEGVDIKDSLFNVFIDAGIAEADRGLPVQKKCLIYIGEEKSIAAVDRIGTIRSESIARYLSEEKQFATERLKFTIVADDSLITSRSTAIYNIGFWVEDP